MSSRCLGQGLTLESQRVQGNVQVLNWFNSRLSSPIVRVISFTSCVHTAGERGYEIVTPTCESALADTGRRSCFMPTLPSANGCIRYEDERLAEARFSTFLSRKEKNLLGSDCHRKKMTACLQKVTDVTCAGSSSSD